MSCRSGRTSIAAPDSMKARCCSLKASTLSASSAGTDQSAVAACEAMNSAPRKIARNPRFVIVGFLDACERAV
jgi:hypothetical protein